MNTQTRPRIIAHRGAPGYLPEHCLPGKALAFAMGADFLEQDVVATRDDELVVLHDIHLDRVTNVAERFPGRARDDGRYYVRDFLLAELRELQVWERFEADGRAVYPGRFPTRCGNFRLHTFAEELRFLAALNKKTNGSVGCYPEIKRPAWHREEGVDISRLFLATLTEHGYVERTDNVFLQCFDAAELRRIREQLNCRLRLVQLIGENSWGEGPTDFDSFKTAAGLQLLARTVDGIGPWIGQLYRFVENNRSHDVKATTLVQDAQAAGLEVHPYTLRKDALPEGFSSFEALHGFCRNVLKVDGVFTDFTDISLDLFSEKV